MPEDDTPEAVGRDATAPRRIPLRGWKNVLWRVGSELVEDRVSMVAASVAFYAILALFPALIATVALYGLLADPHQLASWVDRLTREMPGSARSLVVKELHDLASAPGSGLSFGFAGSMLFSLLSASSGVLGLIDGVNIAYDEEETRGYLRQRFLALCFAVGLSVFVVVAVAVLTILPGLMRHLGLGGVTTWILTALRWPALAASVMGGLSILYRFAPNRTPPRWPWVMWGAGLATAIWLLASYLLSLYVSSIGGIDKTYGALGAIVVLLLWFYVSALAILVGAELNAELEHQTAEDSTVGPDRPMGERGAVMADELGKLKPKSPPESWRERLHDLHEVLLRRGRRKSAR